MKTTSLLTLLAMTQLAAIPNLHGQLAAPADGQATQREGAHLKLD